MAREYLEIGPVPAEETPQPVGMPGYDPYKARKECQAYATQLRRQFGEEPEGASLRVKSFPHDFGSYNEVVCYYDPELPKSVEYAFKCEGDAWETWDDKAKADLGLI